MEIPYRVEDDKLIFDCGCVLDAKDGIEFDPDNVRLECPETWAIFARGDTKGVFQLESYLGRKWSKELRPEHIEHLAALTAILRPGCLKSKVILEPACEANEFKEKSVSITDLYCKRKNKELPCDPFDPSIEDVLSKTFQTMIYQENAMQVAARVAAFTMTQADDLRKAIGKKLPEEMAKVKIKFYDGCRKLGLLSEEKMLELFSWIENSQRYSFNKCLSPDSLVETENGLKTIEELEVGELVNSPEGYCEVLDKIESQQELYEIETESGKKLICSMDHKIRCEDGKMRPLKDVLEFGYKINCI